METLTYNYGETPEGVIRERLAALSGESEGFEVADTFVNWGGYADSEAVAEQRAIYRGFLATFVGTDDLLTTLDALNVVAGGGFEGVGSDFARQSRNLRLSILSALGIEES